MSMECPSCGHLNRPQATWCERCQKGLTLGGRMAEPWGKTGIASRITTTWALLTGSGCLFLFLFPPFGLFLLLISFMTQFFLKKSVAGICPYCGQDTGTIRVKGARPDFPCVHCQQLIRLDTSSGTPVFVKPSGETKGTLGPGEGAASSAPDTDPQTNGESRPLESRSSHGASHYQPGPVGKADWRGINLALGNPKVKMGMVDGGVTCRVRSSSLFGWLWLLGTGMALVVIFTDLAQGDAFVMGEWVPHPSFRHFFALGAFLAFFSLPGLAFTVASYVVTLKPDSVTVRWRVLPNLGWTWTLPAGGGVKVFLAHRGSSANKKPVPALVIASQGREISFGGFLPYDVKEFLGAAIHDYYNGAGLVRTSQAIINS